MVTDSTAYLPDTVAARLAPGRTGVPLETVALCVVVDGRARTEGVDVSTAHVVAALQARRRVTTSRPAPEAFARVYRDLAGVGYRRIVSLHLSGALSGTVDSARAAGAAVAGDGVHVDVVDTGLVAMGLGHVLERAVAVAGTYAPAEQVVAAALDAARTCRGWFAVDSLEHLRRGGRISGASAAVGSALAVKPVLTLSHGTLVVADRVRTTGRAQARLAELVLGEVQRLHAAGLGADVAVQHLGAPERARAVADELARDLPGDGEVDLGEVGAVIGAHTGPGLLGAFVAPRARAAGGPPATP